MTTETRTTVTVTRCTKCGFERFGFSAARGNCPRCASPYDTSRVIASPAPATLRQAISEDHGQYAVGLRVLAQAADYSRRGDAVLSRQAQAQSEFSAAQIAEFFRRVDGGEDALIAAYHATR